MSTGQRAVTLCVREGNRGPTVTRRVRVYLTITSLVAVCLPRERRLVLVPTVLRDLGTTCTVYLYLIHARLLNHTLLTTNNPAWSIEHHPLLTFLSNMASMHSCSWSYNVSHTTIHTVTITSFLLLARLMGQYCFARCRRRLSSSVTLPAGGRPQPGRARGQSSGRHRMAGQYGYVPLGRHLVLQW